MIEALIFISIVAVSAICVLPIIVKLVLDNNTKAIQEAYKENQFRIDSLIETHNQMVGFQQMKNHSIDELEKKQIEALENTAVEKVLVKDYEGLEEEEINNYNNIDEETLQEVFEIFGNN